MAATMTSTFLGRMATASAAAPAKAGRRSALNVVARQTASGRKTASSKTASSKPAASKPAGLSPGTEYAMSLPGATAPLGFFDPLGLSKGASPSDVKRWRESEVTHGRVAMLAALGFIVGENLEDFPAFLNFDGSVTGPAIYHFQQIRQGFWEPLLVCIGLAESYRVSLGWATPTGTGFNSLKEEYSPGTLGFDPLGLLPTDPEERRIIETKELNNGRLAMIAIALFTIQELANPGEEIFEHWFLDVEQEVEAEVLDLIKDEQAIVKAIEKVL